MQCFLYERREDSLEPYNVSRCPEEAGDCFVCDYHRKYAKKWRLERLWAEVRDLVIELSFSAMNEGYRCFHCGHYFWEKGTVCVDHFPRHRCSIRSELMWSIENMVVACMGCNTAGNQMQAASLAGRHREASLLKWQKEFYGRKNQLPIYLVSVTSTLEKHGDVLAEDALFKATKEFIREVIRNRMKIGADVEPNERMTCQEYTQALRAKEVSQIIGE